MVTYNKPFCAPTYVPLYSFKDISPVCRGVARIFKGRKATAALFNLIIGPNIKGARVETGKIFILKRKDKP